jgi:hypothetical protein
LYARERWACKRARGVHPQFGAEIAESAEDAEFRAETRRCGDAGFLGTTANFDGRFFSREAAKNAKNAKKEHLMAFRVFA